MDYQSIVINNSSVKEEGMTSTQRKRSMKSPSNGSSGSFTSDQASETSFAYLRSEGSFESSLRLIERRLEERRQAARRGEGRSSSKSIFRLPHSVTGINQKAEHPEIVSIGPYHRGKDHLINFEENKWSFLEKLLFRLTPYGKDLSQCFNIMKNLEEQTRECYSDIVLMSSHDFVEMMLLDGCFVVELIRHLCKSEDFIDEDDPIFTSPWLIPILIRDLLKLENQLPLFLLQPLFNWSMTDPRKEPLTKIALKVFNLAFPIPMEIINRYMDLDGMHLLDLFRLSLLPSNKVISIQELEEYHPSDQSIQCVTLLRPSGIKFKSRNADSFLDINFQKGVLEIPSITINDFTSTVLINCVALEQCLENKSKHFTDYISFMNCLINQPRDVAFLCSDGIISRFSQDDKYVANLFNKLGKDVAFNIRDSHLSKQFKEVEAYYSSWWSFIMRTYFSSPWSFISVFSAFVLLALTMVQSVISVLSYRCQFG